MIDHVNSKQYYTVNMTLLMKLHKLINLAGSLVNISDYLWYDMITFSDLLYHRVCFSYLVLPLGKCASFTVPAYSLVSIRSVKLIRDTTYNNFTFAGFFLCNISDQPHCVVKHMNTGSSVHSYL